MLRYFYLLLLAMVLSCAPQDRNADKEIFYYNECAGVSSLDPAFANNLENIWWVSQIFNGLVQTDSALNILPCIAKTWDVSENGMIYTFQLREDVQFHDHELIEPNRRVIAQDFVFSFDRIRDPESASPGLWIFDKLDDDHPYEAIDDHTLQIKLERPFPPFLGMLTMPFCYVVPREIVEHYGDDFRSNPIGTGPFKMNFWMEGVNLALVRNDRYFEKDEAGQQLPYLDAVSVSFIPDRSSMFLDFVKGRFDMISGLHKAYRNELLDPQGNLSAAYSDKYYLMRQPYLKTDYLGFQLDPTYGAELVEPFSDVRVRRAIDAALDKKKMVRYIKNNTAISAEQGFVPPSCFLIPKSTEDDSGYDPRYARDLLSEAGYPGGQGIGRFKLSTTSDYMELAEFIQFQLQEIGLEMEVDVVPTSVHREGVSNGQISFFRKSWIADYADPENFLSLFYSQNATPKGSNYTHFTDHRFDELYDLSLSTTDPILRDSLNHTMNNIIAQEVPVIPLFYDMVMRFVSKDVSGLRGNPMNHLDLRRVRKKKV